MIIYGNEEFKTKKEVIERCKEILSKGVHHIEPISPDGKFLEDLFRNHPDYKTKVDGLKDETGAGWVYSFKVGKASYNSRCFYALTEGWDDDLSEEEKQKCSVRFSYKTAVSGTRNSSRADRMTAYRNAVESQLVEFMHTVSVPAKEGVSYQIDHDTPSFATLVLMFENSGRRRVRSILGEDPQNFDDHEEHGTACFRIEDSLWQEEWEKFHKEHAKLQWLSTSEHREKTKEDQKTFMSVTEARKMIQLLEKFNNTILAAELDSLELEDFSQTIIHIKQIWGFV